MREPSPGLARDEGEANGDRPIRSPSPAPRSFYSVSIIGDSAPPQQLLPQSSQLNDLEEYERWKSAFDDNQANNTSLPADLPANRLNSALDRPQPTGASSIDRDGDFARELWFASILGRSTATTLSTPSNGARGGGSSREEEEEESRQRPRTTAKQHTAARYQGPTPTTAFPRADTPPPPS